MAKYLTASITELSLFALAFASFDLRPPHIHIPAHSAILIAHPSPLAFFLRRYTQITNLESTQQYTVQSQYDHPTTFVI
jgi:hypothetical protein